MSYFARSDELPEWAAQIPEGWDSNWLKWSVDLSTKRPTEEEQEALPYISNEDIASWTGKLLIEEPESAEADSRRFQKNDILFNKLRPYLAKVYHATFDGASSGELLCLQPSQAVAPRFLFYVLVSKGFIDTINAETFGAKMPRADWEIVSHQPLPLPPLDTQRRIGRFLDEKTARVDGLIEKKRALLDRLAEKRQALITRAVTKGLNPGAPMKPSGIDWIGNIPAHWELKRLKFGTARIGSGVTPRGGASVYVESGVMLLRSQNVHFEGLALDNIVFIDDVTDNEMSETRVFFGDVLLNITGASIGRCCLFDQVNARANVNQHVCIIRPIELVADFVEMLLASSVGQTQIDLSQNGASREGLNFGDLGNFIVPSPPVSEQGAIAQTVRVQVDAIGEQLLYVLQSICTLEEYRSALVTAAVTGQIKGLC